MMFKGCDNNSKYIIYRYLFLLFVNAIGPRSGEEILTSLYDNILSHRRLSFTFMFT